MGTVAKSDQKLPSQQTQPSYRRVPRTYHDGKSPASWVGSMGSLAGFVIGSIGFLIMQVPVIVLGGVVVLVSLIATIMLRSLGFGEGTGYDGRMRS